MPKRLFLLIFALVGCVHTPYEGETSAERSVVVETGGGLEGSVRCIADGRFLVRESYRFDFHGHFPLREQKKIALTPEQWIEFWHAVNGFGIERWNPRYSVDSLGVQVTDSPGWSVDLRMHGKRFHSEGDAAYPQIDNPRRSTENIVAVQRLFELFERFGATPSRS